jgi:hypothetical protein
VVADRSNDLAAGHALQRRQVGARLLGDGTGLLDVEDAVKLLGVLLLEEPPDPLSGAADRVAELLLHGPT